jgi:tRNA pseudouridine38-40 synthase
MPRYRITIEYDGTPFVGWQMQANGRSVQGEIQSALKRFTQETAVVHGAGRTDAGVHARGQVAHFDLVRTWDPLRLREAFNFHLRPYGIAIIDCQAATADFEARFSATGRSYLYRILARRAPPTLEVARVWWLPFKLDAAAMHEAAQVLVGRHDFTTFRAAACQAASPVKTLDRLDVVSVGDEIHIQASARSFLHNQVRSMVGTLKEVGTGRWNVDVVREALVSCDRSRCGAVAPPQGLYLMAVDYAPRG